MSDEKPKNLKALVDVRHFPDGRPPHATRPVVIPAGRVVARGHIAAEDLVHLLRNGHVVETDDAVSEDVAAPAPTIEQERAPATVVDAAFLNEQQARAVHGDEA